MTGSAASIGDAPDVQLGFRNHASVRSACRESELAAEPSVWREWPMRRRYVFARETTGVVTYYWQCVDPTSPEAGTSLTLHDLTLVARRDVVSIISLDASSSTLVVGPQLGPIAPNIKNSGTEQWEARLCRLPTYQAYMDEWSQNEALRVATKRHWDRKTI